MPKVPTLRKLPSLVPRSGSEGAEASIFTAGQDFLAAGAARIAINGAEMDHLKYRHKLMSMPVLPVWPITCGIYGPAPPAYADLPGAGGAQGAGAAGPILYSGFCRAWI